MKFLLPTACIGCKSYQPSRICDKCLNRLIRSQIHRCFQCALPTHPNAIYCAQCQYERPYFDETVCLDSYEGLLTGAVRQYKYSGEVAIAHGLIETWFKIFDNGLFKHRKKEEVILSAVPLSTIKLHERGFNQSWELAKIFGQKTGAMVNAHILTRRHLDTNQAKLGKAERLSRLENIFSISPENQAYIRNKCIVIVDDVMTTGATLNSMSKLLKKHGAKEIINWVILRTPLK